MLDNRLFNYYTTIFLNMQQNDSANLGFWYKIFLYIS